MRFLADESVEAPLVEQLRGDGFDVEYVAERNRVAEDAIVLQLAADSRRILVTNDKDFAELTFLRRQVSEGIVLLRLPRLRSAAKAERLHEVLRDVGERLRGAMTVVAEDVVRCRRFPRFD